MKHGAKFRENVRVASVSYRPSGNPSVRLASGEMLEADVVVGADGPNSAARTRVLDYEEPDKDTGLSVFQ